MGIPLTRKQFAILHIISYGNPEGITESDKRVSLDEILERIPYETSKASMQFSIRSMIEGGYISKAGKEKRDGRQRVLFSVTDVGLYRLNPKAFAPEASFISDVGLEDEFGDFHSEVL